MAYKVFTNGSVLQASEINDNLMRQSVMVFSNSGARTAAITSPIEGMLTWLEDVNRYESYNGTAWVSPFGLTQLINTNFTTAGSIAVDNVFTSQWDNYKIQLKIDAATGGTSTQINLQYRKAAATVSATNYRNATFYSSIDGGTTGILSRVNGGSVFTLGFTGVPSTPSTWNLDVFTPNIASTYTSAFLQGMISYNGTAPSNSSNFVLYGASNYTANDNLDGVVITPGSGTISGNIKIYGYRN